jgi:TatD DNase family protein
MIMLIDIHRHSSDKDKANVCVRNLFHNQTGETSQGEFYSVGLHPWHVQEPTLGQDLDMVSKAAVNPQIIAIGETGLDKTIAAPLEIQLQAFKAQIEIAKETDKPMVIHCVRAYNEVYGLKVKSHHKKPWLIHWFNANENMGHQLINHGFYLSFGHMLFNQESKAFKSFPNIPLEYIFFETDDAGYGIDEVYQRASELLSVPLSSLEKRIEQNFINFFGFAP